jgi:hypothetical protein
MPVTHVDSLCIGDLSKPHVSGLTDDPSECCCAAFPETSASTLLASVSAEHVALVLHIMHATHMGCDCFREMYLIDGFWCVLAMAVHMWSDMSSGGCVQDPSPRC